MSDSSNRNPKDLRAFLCQFNAKDALFRIASASAHLLHERKFIAKVGGGFVSADALAYVADQILRHGSSELSVRLNDVALGRACSMYTDLYDFIETVDPNTPLTEKERILARTSIRMANLQYPFQEEYYIALPRIAVLLQDQAERIGQDARAYIDQTSRRLFGLGIDEYIRIGVLLVASIALQRPHFLNLAKLAESDIPELTRELQFQNLQRFCSGRGLTMDQYRESDHKFEVPTYFEKYRFLELQAKPIVLLDESRICVPSSHLLVWGTSTGLFFAISDQWRDVRPDNPFRERVGRLFQDYVGRVVEEGQLLQNKGWVLIPEFQSRSGQNSTDWMLVNGDNAILIECKTSRLRLESRALASGEYFEVDAERCFVHPLHQLSKFVVGLRDRSFEHELLQRCKHFFGIVVSFEPLRCANSAYPLLFSERIRDVSQSLDAFQFMAIEELERLMSMSNLDLLGILKSKTADSPSLEWGSYLSTKYPPPGQHPILRQKLNSLFPGLDEF